MTEAGYDFITTVLLVALVFDVMVFLYVARAARIPPPLPVLNIAAARTLGITVGIACAVVVALHVIAVQRWELRLIPREWVVGLLTLAVLFPSLGNVPTLVQAYRWKRERERRAKR